jgi:hypothetical protein
MVIMDIPAAEFQVVLNGATMRDPLTNEHHLSRDRDGLRTDLIRRDEQRAEPARHRGYGVGAARAALMIL